MDLSIVIPALNEAHKIGHDVTAIGEFLQRHKLTGEAIIVDDGSTDETARVAEQTPLPAGVERQVVRHPQRRGKGAAVRSGMLASRGDFALFADSGVSVPFDYALQGLELLRAGECELAHGSRKMAGTVITKAQPLRRQIISRLFVTLVPPLLGLPRHITDTQCGFKMYRGEVARELYGQCFVNGFMFDVEVIRRAQAAGYRLREFPIEWHCDHDTRVHTLKQGLGLMWDVGRIWWRVPRHRS